MPGAMLRKCFPLITLGCLLLAVGCARETPDKNLAGNQLLPREDWTEPPAEWIDPDTGHRVIRLSSRPGTASLYFHQNPYTAEGDKLVVQTDDGIGTIDLNTREQAPLVQGPARGLIVGRQSRKVFYIQQGSIFETHMDSGATREIVKLPGEIAGGSGLAVNADETLLAGSYIVGPENRFEGVRLRERWENRKPMRLYTVEIATGKIRTFHERNDWLNHVQMSPTDPDLIMFCHEGPWHEVDRIWTIRRDGSNLKLMHERTMPMEIAGHEFFGPDGRMIWFDLQTPRSEQFWVAGVDVKSGETVRYRLEPEEWSVHYNISPDGKLFAGDGGGPNSVAAPNNGQWIYLFTPRDGRFESERLVNLARHDYELEPNVTFTPDGKWIVFRSNMFGPTHTFAVEVEKSGAAGTD